MNDIVIYIYCPMDMSSVDQVQVCPGRAIARVPRNLVPKVSLSQELDYISTHSRIRGMSKPLSIRV